jgi:RHS repeat-associated protein
MTGVLRQLLGATLSFLLAAPAYSHGPNIIYEAPFASRMNLWDGHGSVRALTDATGTVTDTYDYDAFGNLIHSTGTTYNNYLFAGEQFDPDLNLYYNRARYLNTGTGRFWTIDTDEGLDQDPLSLHKYLYADANPINRRDPSGHDSIAEFDIASAIEETLNTISGVQKFVRIENQISSVFDFLSSIVDLSIAMGSGGLDGLGVSSLAQKIGSAASDRLGRDVVESPLNLFSSIAQNAPRIAEANLLSPSKDVKLLQAFKASDSAVLLYLPGFIGSLPGGPLSTGLKVAGRPLKLTTQGGAALLGMGFQGGGSGPVQLFHVDLVIPLIAPGHSGAGGGDLDAWYDGNLNYQVPEN